MDDSVTLVIPAYNEAEALPGVLPGMLKHCSERGWKLIVIDDGSCDGTTEYLKSLGKLPELSIFYHKVNRGYGAALKTGLSQVGTDYAVTMDADGQHQLADIDLLLGTLHTRDADMVIGSRQEASSSGAYRQLGKWIIRTITRAIMPLNVRDLNSGFKLYHTPLVQRYLTTCPDSMAFSDVITLIFINRGHRVIETPVQVQQRTRGKSTINTWTAVETVLEVLNIVMLFKPLRIFLPISIFCILVGILWGIPIILLGRGVSVGSMLAIVSGLVLFSLGLLAEQLSQIRKDTLTRSGSDWKKDGQPTPVDPHSKTEE
jgi:glycosyltransferase involved in cell wall biosynthesis